VAAKLTIAMRVRERKWLHLGEGERGSGMRGRRGMRDGEGRRHSRWPRQRSRREEWKP